VGFTLLTAGVISGCVAGQSMQQVTRVTTAAKLKYEVVKELTDVMNQGRLHTYALHAQLDEAAAAVHHSLCHMLKDSCCHATSHELTPKPEVYLELEGSAGCAAVPCLPSS
jgi:hypothetical protein